MEKNLAGAFLQNHHRFPPRTARRRVFRGCVAQFAARAPPTPLPYEENDAAPSTLLLRDLVPCSLAAPSSLDRAASTVHTMPRCSSLSPRTAPDPPSSPLLGEVDKSTTEAPLPSLPHLLACSLTHPPSLIFFHRTNPSATAVARRRRGRAPRPNPRPPEGPPRRPLPPRRRN